MLAETYGLSEKAAVATYVAALLDNELVIAIARKDGEPINVWITDDPTDELQYTPEGETLELRFWNGKQWLGR